MSQEKRYEKWIKSQPCAHCGATEGVTWHHAIGYGNGIMGGKAPWFMTMPMCGVCHMNIHRGCDSGEAAKWQLRLLEKTLKKAIEDGVLEVK